MCTTAQRNNNPGNLKNDPDDPWNGTIGQDDRGHAIFEDVVHGVRAMAKTILAKWNNGYNTLIEMIGDPEHGWAPASDTQGSIPGNPPNDPVEYATTVGAWLSIGIDAVMPLGEDDGQRRDFLIGLCRSIIHYEAGFEWVSLADLDKGVDMALGNE